MNPIKGHLLVTEVGLETLSIDKAERDQCVLDFFIMKEYAEREHDRWSHFIVILFRMDCFIRILPI